jgi:hypothetical protein
MVQATAYLRSTPSVLNSQFNISQVGGTASRSAGQTGVVSVGGSTVPLAVPTVYPVLVGAHDQASGVARRLLADYLGRLLLPSVQPAAGMQNLFAQAVTDTSLVEGLSNTELLNLILRELKIHSFYLSELPRKLHKATEFASDEPEAYRTDPTILAS